MAIVYDERAGAYYDDQTGQWVAPPAVPANDAPVSAGQAIATILLAPLVLLWVLESYGVDVLSWLDRLGR